MKAKFGTDVLQRPFSAETLFEFFFSVVESIEWLKGAHTSDVQHWNIDLGKTIRVIQSSRFCLATLISELNDARTNAKIFRTTEGKELVETLEFLCQQKSRERGQSSSPLNILAVLQKCGLLSNESRPSFVLDISGNGRYVSELVESGVFYPEQCLAVLCQNCAVQCNGAGFQRVVVDNCSSHNASEVEKLRSFGREEIGGRIVSDECLAINDASYTSESYTKTRMILGSFFKPCQPVERFSYDEISSKTFLLSQCASALSLLQQGDCLVLEVCDTLTQFTVGIIYILHLLFKEIALISPKFCPTSKQFLVCHGFFNANEATTLLAHMEKVLEVLTSKPAGKDVIGFLPIKELFSENFYKYIRRQSTNHVAAQLHWIVKCERLFLSKNAC
jgi:hypothetical protein